MEFLTSIKGAIAWVGGAIAALTALCYAAGYLSYHAHLAMLGLNGTIAFPHDQMLLEGAQFLLGLVSALLLDAFMSIVVVIVVTLTWIVARRLVPVPAPVVRAKRIAVSKWHHASGRHPHLVPAIALLALATLLAWHYGQYFEILEALGTQSHLLFTQQTALYPCTGLEHAAKDVVARITAGIIIQGEACRTDLASEFMALVQGYFLLLVIVGLVMSRVGARLAGPVRTLVKTSIGLYAGAYTLWLPSAYGVLVRAPIYPLADVAIVGGGVARGWLLSRGTDGLLLWREDSRSAMWYPADRTGQVRVVNVGNVFDQGIKR